MDGLNLSIDAIKNQTYQNTKTRKTDGTMDSQDEFLLLLVTQLKNQDPLNPLESQEFAVQLAQFSQVERLMNIESALEGTAKSNELMSQATNKSLAALLMGKTVRSVGNGVVHFAGEQNVLQYELSRAANTVSAYVKDADGTIIRTYELGSMEVGEHNLVWDGQDEDGNAMPDGVYTFEIAAKDSSGEAVALNHYQVGYVEGVRYQDSGLPILIINGEEIPLSDVREIRGDYSELLDE